MHLELLGLLFRLRTAMSIAKVYEDLSIWGAWLSAGMEDTEAGMRLPSEGAYIFRSGAVASQHAPCAANESLCHSLARTRLGTRPDSSLAQAYLALAPPFRCGCRLLAVDASRGTNWHVHQNSLGRRAGPAPTHPPDARPPHGPNPTAGTGCGSGSRETRGGSSGKLKERARTGRSQPEGLGRGPPLQRPAGASSAGRRRERRRNQRHWTREARDPLRPPQRSAAWPLWAPLSQPGSASGHLRTGSGPPGPSELRQLHPRVGPGSLQRTARSPCPPGGMQHFPVLRVD